MNKIFDIWVQKHSHSKQVVISFWRQKKDLSGVTEHIIPIRTQSTLKRLQRVIPPKGSEKSVYNQDGYFSVDFKILENWKLSK